MNDPDGDLAIVEKYKDTELGKRLLERLSEADAAYVIRLLADEGYCSRCFGQEPWCCYDPQE